MFSSSPGNKLVQSHMKVDLQANGKVNNFYYSYAVYVPEVFQFTCTWVTA